MAIRLLPQAPRLPSRCRPAVWIETSSEMRVGSYTWEPRPQGEAPRLRPI